MPSSSVPIEYVASRTFMPRVTCSGSGSDVDDVAAHARALAVDHGGDERHRHAGRGEGDDRERAHLALGRHVDLLEPGGEAGGAGVAPIEEARHRTRCTGWRRGADGRRARGSRRGAPGWERRYRSRPRHYRPAGERLRTEGPGGSQPVENSWESLPSPWCPSPRRRRVQHRPATGPRHRGQPLRSCSPAPSRGPRRMRLERAERRRGRRDHRGRRDLLDPRRRRPAAGRRRRAGRG